MTPGSDPQCVSRRGYGVCCSWGGALKLEVGVFFQLWKAQLTIFIFLLNLEISVHTRVLAALTVSTRGRH